MLTSTIILSGDKQKLTITCIELPYGVDKKYQDEIITQIKAEIAKKGEYEVIHFDKEAKELKEVLTETDLKRLCSREVALKIGKALKVELVIFGFLTNIDINKALATCHITIHFKLLDVENNTLKEAMIKGESAPKVGYEGKVDALIKEAIAELAKNFAAELPQIIKVEKVEKRFTEAEIVPKKLTTVSLPPSIKQEERRKVEFRDLLLGAGALTALILAQRREKKREKEEGKRTHIIKESPEALRKWRGYGTGSYTTEKFVIPPPCWNIEWRVEPDFKEPSNSFKIEIYDDKGNLYATPVNVTNLTQVHHTFTSFYYTPGRFSLHIKCENIKVYKVEVFHYGWPGKEKEPEQKSILSASGVDSKGEIRTFRIPDRRWKIKMSAKETTWPANHLCIDVYDADTRRSYLKECLEKIYSGEYWRWKHYEVYLSGNVYLRMEYLNLSEWLVEIFRGPLD